MSKPSAYAPTQLASEGRWGSIEEAQGFYCMCRATVRRRIADGTFKARKFGGLWRVWLETPQ